MNVLQTLPLSDQPLAQVQWGAAIGASLAAAVFDVRARRIPNKLSLTALALGLVWALWTASWPGLAESFGATLFLALPFVVLWLYGGGGAGDAKLMGAVGAWLGFANGIVALLAVVTWGAVLGVFVAMFKGRLRCVLRNLQNLGVFWMVEVWRGNLLSRQSRAPAIEGLPMPYGVSILCGVLTAAAGVMLWRTQG